MVMRFDPFRELDRLSQSAWGGGAGAGARAVPMDAYRRGDHFYVHFDLPGVEAAAIELTVEKNVLNVRAERRWEREDGDEILIKERPEGDFTRQLFLGETLDADNIKADYDQGVLTLAIPIAERAKARRVEIGGAAHSPQHIDAESRRS